MFLAASAALASMLAACGADTGAPAEATLESWRKTACALDSEPVPPQTPPDPSHELTSGLGEPVEEMRELVKSLRAIPAPDDHRDEIERLIELVETGADRYEAALPRIREASRRLEQAMASIDESELPPLKEPMTVAGGIMTQMMSVPAVKEAFEEMMAAYEPLESSVDQAEAKRLTEALGLDRCSDGRKEESRLSPAELARCGSRGEPVSVQELVDIFRSHGLSLSIDEHTCTVPTNERVGGFDSDATNAGPRGRSQPEQVEREEGYVLCTLDESGVDHELVVNKYSTDTETSFSVHNVRCYLYPHSTATEADQVARVRKAMTAVAGSVPKP